MPVSQFAWNVHKGLLGPKPKTAPEPEGEPHKKSLLQSVTNEKATKLLVESARKRDLLRLAKWPQPKATRFCKAAQTA